MGLSALVSEMARAIGFSRLPDKCRRDLRILERRILGPEFQKRTDSQEKARSGWVGMVRHGWRGAFGMVYDNQVLIYSDEEPVMEVSADLGEWHPSRSWYWGAQER